MVKEKKMDVKVKAGSRRCSVEKAFFVACKAARLAYYILVRILLKKVVAEKMICLFLNNDISQVFLFLKRYF